MCKALPLPLPTFLHIHALETAAAARAADEASAPHEHLYVSSASLAVQASKYAAFLALAGEIWERRGWGGWRGWSS